MCHFTSEMATAPYLYLIFLVKILKMVAKSKRLDLIQSWFKLVASIVAKTS